MADSRLTKRLRMLGRQAAAGDLRSVRTDLASWAWSCRYSVGMRRDLRALHTPPGRTDLALTARPLDDDLARVTFDPTGLGDADRKYLERRRSMWEAGFNGGFVAVTDDGEPAYLQWLIPHSDADKVRRYWGPLFPAIEPDTLLVEGAWVPPRFRGNKVMGDALHLVSEAAAEAAPDSVRWALCFPEGDNKGAVLGSRDAGYQVVLKRTERWCLGRRHVSFTAATEDSFDVFAPTAEVR